MRPMSTPIPSHQGTDVMAYMLNNNNNGNATLIIIFVIIVFVAVAVIMGIGLVANYTKTSKLISEGKDVKLPSLIRTSLAFSILLIICGVLGYLLLSGEFDIIGTVLSSLVSIFGTIIGFYFGNREKNNQ